MVGSGEGSVLFTTFIELTALNGAHAAIVPIVKSIRASGWIVMLSLYVFKQPFGDFAVKVIGYKLSLIPVFVNV